jgi:branched-chain amino acid transport system substrate-binding protein
MISNNVSSKVSITALLLLVILTGCVSTPTGQVIAEKTLYMGFIGPLTGDGAAWGLIEKNSLDLAVMELNNQGGINGEKIVILYEDGKCEGPTALSAAQKLININQVKFIHASCSQEIIPIAPLTEQHKVILFGAYSASSNIKDAGDFVFRTSWANKDYARSIADTIPENQRVATISENSEFARDLLILFEQQYSKQGNVITSELFSQGEKNVQAQITKILSLNPDAVFVNPNGPATGILILKQLDEQGFEGQIYGNFFGSSLDVQQSTSSEGMIYFSDPLPLENKKSQTFFDAYTSKYECPDLTFPAASRYDAMMVLAKAIETVGEDTSMVRDYLYELDKYEGVLGNISFDENGDAENVIPSAMQIKNGLAIAYD